MTVGLCVPSCSKGARKTNMNKEGQQEIITISVERPTKEEIELTINTTGSFYPFEEAMVAFEVDGRITEIYKDLGDFVKKGETLAKISSEEYILRKEQAEADMKNAEVELKRTSDLFGRGFATEQQMDRARRNMNIAKAQYDLALKKMRDCQLRSPITGFISKRMYNVGEYARTASQAFYIVNTFILKFRAEIAEKYSGYVKVGDRVSIKTDSVAEVEGFIHRISPVVNAASRAFAVEARIENRDGNIKPGSFGSAMVFTSHRYPAITISEDSVTYFSGTPRVFKIKDLKAIEQIVKIKERVGNRLVVESGVDEDDIIASSLVELLTNNQVVKIKE